ncbi:amino acid adenylation domain-containing protein [Corallococcus exercitus]|uniref:Amino acid adenylation domain-containing protein n=1 Tax=Corallococcus exercitus TaxID=2316736 RepID=A0A7Y4KE87_9BACT|nr:non-ribosomal peptide synthetase [Corallococcus exercitus]NOK32233.1 amino acid adenylation domain-containing protein [Corallococcus exercitus]
MTPEQKRARLAELLRTKVRPTQAPVSFSQERMWFQDRLSPGSAAFNIPVRVRFSGVLDVAVLRASLQALVRRHAPLRTTFIEQDGRPVQHIAPALELALPVVDLQALPASEREAELQRLLTDEARQPFDLEKGPLLVTVLYRLDALEHVLLLKLHHIITDGWSMGVLVRELSALYLALAEGKPSPLSPLPMQYADYAAWQREFLRGEVLESHLGWWRERLDPDAVLELPTDRPRAAVLSGRGARINAMLPVSLVEAIKALALTEGNTLFGVLLSAFQVLLSRYSGQQDVVVGTSVAGRGRVELEGLIGLFTNYLAFRTDLSGQPSFRELLARVRETTLEAYAHQDVPFEKLVDALKPERQLSVNPLFQVALTLQNAPLPPLQLPGLVLDAQPVDNRTSKTDLSLIAMELPQQGMRLTAEYSTDLFDPGSIQRLLAHLRTLLEGAVADPDRRVSELPLMDAAEAMRIQREWAGNAAPFPEDRCLHSLFEAQTQRMPGAVAVQFQGQALTYAQLDARANQLAHSLRRRGVGPEARVALSVERSLDVAVGLLGILKAGGAWVPVDPLLPRERLAFMLEDSGASVLVTQAPLLERFPEGMRARALCLDAERDRLAGESVLAPASGVGPRNLAYVLYTSGSTGTPKGTAIEHRGVCNLVAHEATAYGIGPGSRVLQFASLSFDLSVEEIFTTLCSGATLVLAPLEDLMPGEPLRKLLRDEALTVISLTPATLAATAPEGLPALRTVISGGEALPPEVVARWAPGRTFLNTYGPTEATVMATLTECTADGRVPSIGRPLANVRAYVLDARGGLVPVGVKGELHLGGVGVARGYAGRPALTAERFVPDAFSGEAGARLYRTGDVVRWREDGTLEFVGRADAQVKVRGFRIELGEVEAALAKLPPVRDAVVVAREDGPGGKRLVGYVVLRDGVTAQGPGLRADLKNALPEYMVPSAVVVLPALPLTTNGKVDRKALPAPDLAGSDPREYVAPRTPTEQRLAGLWQELLGVTRVGAHDHFFDLGGHSLLATQALSRIRQAFTVELPLRRLFESPTLDAVARLIDEALAGKGQPVPAPRRSQESRTRSVPTVPLEDVAREWKEQPQDTVAPFTAELRQRVLVEWNATEAEYPRNATLPEVFARVVARFPEKVAVEFGDARLTYRQLEERANRLAWHLRSLGVDTDSRVAVALERSLELVVSLVAILKAGAAYVPLDPAYPQARLAAMVEDARPHVLLTSRALLPKLPHADLLPVVLEEVSLDALPAHAPPSSALPLSLAYIDFTSGSTGRPKGVGTPHAAVLRTVFGVDYARFGPDETLLLMAPLAFDASTLEVWGALLHGAKLAVFPAHPPADPHELERVLVRHGVTTLWLTSGLFTQVVDSHLPALRSLRQVLTGGDVVSAPHVRKVLEQLSIPVTAGYGPTETTVFATSHRFTQASQVGASVPLGRPLGNTQVYVLDASGQPVPPGVQGEIFVGGDGLARGYVGQPALTAERFVPDAFSGEAGARLYRTGDLGRWRDDGVLEFLGRADVQVKVRGFRIELAEIEAALLVHSDVREAVVIAREDVPGDKRLIAYVVAPASLDVTELRAFLKQRLPDYMVPSMLGRLDALPLTSNGKVDRKALPHPSTFQTRTPTRPPRTDTERLLATLWEEVLQTGTVGAEDHFFELGGSSLSATQVLSRIRRTFQAELSIADFFAAPTVEAIARRLESQGPVRPALSVPALKPVPRDGDLPLSFAQQRLWFFAKLEPESAAYNLPFVMRLEGALDVPALAAGLRDLLQRHESLRTTFREQASGPVQVITAAPTLPAAWMDLSALPDAEHALRSILDDEARQVFDLEAGPLWRVLVVRMSARHHLLLLTMHHVISDAWSMGVLLQELTTLYAAHSEGQAPRLKPLPVQYADFSVWQRDWLRDAALEAQLGWWRAQLHGAPKALELPTDRPRPAAQTFRGAVVPFQFPRELSDAMQALCRSEGVTPSMVVLATFQMLLSRYSGQEDVCVGSPIAGRHHAELEGLIGFFVNTLVLRTKLDGDPSFRELLSRVRDVALGAYAHQDVPFEKLVEALRPERDPRRTPLFQVMLAYQNAPMPETLTTGLRLHPLEPRGGTAKFDLTLALNDTADGLKGLLEYNTDLFDAATASRMVGHLRALLDSAVHAPERRLSALPMLTLEERELLSHSWSKPGAATAEDASLHGLLQAQARLHPDLTAFEHEGTPLTWAEAYQRAREVLRALRGRGVVALPPPPPLVPVARTGPLPLSFAQQRLWLVDQLEPGSAAYNLFLALRVEGALDVGALERSFAALIARHESLRTVFVSREGEPVQVILPTVPFALETVDLGEVSDEVVTQRLQAEALRPFDLERGPLLRAALLRLAPRTHVLWLNMHHIVSDGWSMGVLVRELSALYGAQVSRQPSPLPPLPVQYVDYAAWQRVWLKDEVLEHHLAYWRRQLAGVPPLLELPTDKPRPRVQSQRGAQVPVQLSGALTEALQALCQRERATLFMGLVTAWQVLLSRYSGQEDIPLGSPIAGRTREDTEGLIGFFVNTLVLRTHVDARSPFRELLGQVRATTLAAYEHQDAPFEKLVEELQPRRSLSHSPLFQVLLALQNAPVQALSLPGDSAPLRLLPLEQAEQTTQFDLTLALARTPQGLQGALSYRTDLFEASTAARMVEHLRTLLEAAVAKPDEAVGRLPLLTASERHHLLVTWNQTQAEYPRDATIPRLFEAQARRTPEAIAVVSGAQRLTYRELEARANQLAHRLRKLGVGPESRVGLCVERTTDVVVGTLGILKAGGAYVPLDPRYPKDRLGWLLEDANGPALVAHSHLLASLPAFTAQAVCLDRGADLDREPATAPPAGVHPENVAYLIYTSGSTGRPKGVAVTHRNAVAFLAWATETFTEEETKAVLAATSLNFDLSVFELFAPLVRGGSVVVVRDALSLAEARPDAEVTLINTVPSAMAQLVRMGTVPPSVRVVNLAGEALPETLAKAVYAVPTVRKLYNLYGPSEDTTYSTASRVERDEVPNIGRPLTNTRAYVLDANLQPVPIGVAGELYLAGEGQARGYLARPELTAERFVPELHGPAGSRMYRTGDRVRYRADGVLEYLGRVDFQVKVRGFRIELGEVESALRQHAAVKDAVVVAKGEGEEKRLVAYVAPKPGAALETKALKADLRQRLPEYMVPGTVVVLEALPLNANGKVDRKALPEPEALTSGNTYEAPRTELEATLAAIWAQVLRVPRVGVRDDFFALGGHSLLATQVVSRVRTETGAQLPLRALFEAPSVESLASRVEAALRSRQAVPRPPLVAVARTGPLPLSFAQQRLWFLDRLQPGSVHYNIPAALRLDGPLDTEALTRGLRELVHRHEALRTTFHAREDGEPVQHPHAQGELTVSRVELRQLPEAEQDAEVRRLALEEARRPFDLTRAPLMRATLLRLSEQRHVLLVTLHHIVSDGWSNRVLVEELGALYAAFSRGQPSPLPPLALQYADFAAWQRDWLKGEVLEQQVGWWKRQLAGAPHALELPTDKPRPAVQTYQGAQVPVVLSQEASRRLKALCQQEVATPFMALLALWQVLLASYSGQEDFAVGSPIAGREHGELEGLVGFFVNTLVLRAQVDRRGSFRQLLRRVKEVALGAYAHQDLPFERLVEELKPARDPSRGPLFQVLFTLRDTTAPRSPRGEELKLHPLDVEDTTAKFDLELSLAESPEGFVGTLGYNTALFEPRTAARMAEHFRTLAEGLVARPEAPLESVSLLTPTERQQVLVEWNTTEAEYPRGATLPEVFARVAARFPEKVAVELGDMRLTYRQLEERANRLAWHLRSLGVDTDSRVAVALERSLELVVSLVAILKAGAAYVPLDPAYPRERLAAMVEDARPHVLLTSRALLPKLPHADLLPVVLEEVSLDALPAHAPPSSALPLSLAYIDFTSGSTGRPKGVGTPHAAVLRTVFGVDYAHFGPDETLLLMAPLAFDASTLEVWGALLHGSKLAVFPAHPPTDPHELEKVLVHHGVTTLWLTSGLFTQVVDSHLPALRSLRQVLTGGDVVSAPHVRKVLEQLSIPVTAGYGPTETTVFATSHRFTQASQVGASVPLGRPLGNTQVYVLDASGQPVPPGVQGEIFVGGDGLARGYVGQPALTAERFLPDPFATTPGARLYRTGDLGRWRNDGVLEFLGRADVQVKVRGFRIELAEIEAALLVHSDVREAVVIAREDVPGDKRLIAYVVAPASLDMTELRAFLKQRLPDYMVPSTVVRLDALPLTSNGKVDRKALPAPDSATSAGDYVAPRTVLEEQLARSFAEVLRVPRVSVTDSFFDLGGHSLLALRLMAAIREHTGQVIPMTALFQHSTVEQLARRVRQEASALPPNLVRLDAGTSSARALFLVHGGGGSALGYAELVRQLGDDRPVYGLSASGLDGGALPPASIEALARDYLAQVRAVQPQGPYLLGGWSFGGLVALEMSRQLQLTGEQVELLALMDSTVPTPQPRPAADPLGMLALFARTLGLPWQELSLELDRLRRLEGREQLAYVLEQLRNAPVKDLGLDLDGAEHLFALHSRLYDAQRGYVPGGGYSGPTLLFQAATARTESGEPDWSTWLTGPLTRYEVPGDHYTMLSAPHAATVAERLRHHLRAL